MSNLLPPNLRTAIENVDLWVEMEIANGTALADVLAGFDGLAARVRGMTWPAEEVAVSRRLALSRARIYGAFPPPTFGDGNALSHSMHE
ncbi:hypothetical protein ACFFGH_02350 [Lysobacter korlensis]|uniref:Uncharacterized protein n=1 Tax=Lysobacter korlensis TaxID=553636 RepID=A0ABV6RI81_9GAMM